MPSMVVTSRLSASSPNIRHERIDRPSTSTVQVPHSPSSQPCLVPVNAKSSRKTSSRVLCGAKATSAASPLSENEMCAFWFIKVCGNAARRNFHQRGDSGVCPNRIPLRYVKHHVINQTRLADEDCHREQRRPLVDLVQCLESFGIVNADVIDSREGF